MTQGENHNGFPLVRKPSSAVEKAAPGAKRILSGMVADTLALAKPIFTVFMCDDQISDGVELLIKFELDKKCTLRFIRFTSATELQKLAREQSFDLIFLYLYNVHWDAAPHIPCNKDANTFEALRDYLVGNAKEILGHLKSQYGKPIIAVQGMDLTEQLRGTGINFLIAPFDFQDIRAILKANFPAQYADPLALAKKKLSPRIVVVDDDEDLRRLIAICIKNILKDATVLTFGSPEIALKELFQTDPDLLLLDTRMPRMDCVGFLRILTTKKGSVAYPILVMSGGEHFDFLNLSEAGQTLNAKILQKPFDEETFKKALETALKIKIPRDTPTQNEIISTKSRSLNRRGTLLVVDDEDGPRQSLRVIFENEYDLFFAEDGPTAIELAQQHNIDVVVTDIYMPGMSGIEVLERVKYIEPDIEVIIMTTFETPETRLKAGQLGASDYINMPFDLATMRAAVSKAMQRRTLKSEITAARKTTGINTEKVSDQPLQTRPLRIVMVDDDADWLDLMVEVFREWFKDAELVTFTRPLEALRELEQRDPDLLITGAKMPRIDGEQMVRLLIAKNINYPILVLAGYEPAQHWVREYASQGFNVGFLSKGDFQRQPEQLKRNIEEMLNRQRSK